MQKRLYFAFMTLCYACVAMGHEPFKLTKVDDSGEITDSDNITSSQYESLSKKLDALTTEMALVKGELQHLRKLNSKCNSEVGFTAWMSSETTVNDGDRVIFDGVLTNIGDHYNPSTGVFTVPTTGVYMFALQAHSLKKDPMRASIFNGVNVLLSVAADKGGDSSGSSTAVAIAQCTEGDHIYVEGIRDGDAIFGASTDRYSSFAGYLLMITE